MDFYQQLAGAARRNDSLLCVGLDPHSVPDGQTLLDFARRIVDATADLVCAYKPNFAFYEARGPAGLEALQAVVEHVHQHARVPVILDAKRGDIGSTAQAYARAAFDVWGADAVTLNPYLGHDAVAPFTAYAGRGVFLLCHTSNPGAADLQALPCPARPLYEVVAHKAAQWGAGLVVGATYPQALARVRAVAPGAWILLPGVGAQGGDLEAALAAGLRPDGLGLVVNSSRGICYAPDPRRAACDLRQRINDARRRAPHPRLDDHSELILALADIGAVQFGDFTLASGQRSPIYIDLRLLASHPEVLAQVALVYAQVLAALDFHRLAAIPYAALPIGTAVSLATGRPLIYPRKEAKAHGGARQIEGAFEPGEKAVVLDDVITTGASKLAAIAPLEAAGLEVQDVVVLIDREGSGRADLAAAGYRLHAAFRLTDLVEALARMGRIQPHQRDRVIDFLAGDA
jgi:uridine monophosphate synthetase